MCCSSATFGSKGEKCDYSQNSFIDKCLVLDLSWGLSHVRIYLESFRTPSLSRMEFQGYCCPSSETKYISTLVPLHISWMINRRALTYCITMVRGQPIICAAQIHLSNQNRNQSITCYCSVVERSYVSYGHVCGSEKYGTSSIQPYYETANKTLEKH